MKTDRTDPEILINKDHISGMIDRMFNMEFLSDQMFGCDDEFNPPWGLASHRDLMQYSFLGYII